MTADLLTVRVGDLWTGAQNCDLLNRYFPDYTFDVLEDTFALLMRQPATLDEDLPVYPVWQRMCRALFGGLPGPDSPLIQGRLWRWEMAVKRFRAMAESFGRHGYDPARIGGGEHYQARIDPDGRICVVQGNKRVALLRLKDRDFRIKVEIAGRAQRWLDCHGTLRSAGRSLYQPMDHPDFAAWPVSQPCTERMRMMDGVLGASTGAVVDLGSHAGWFCRRFTERGWTATGVERNPQMIAIARTQNLWNATPLPNYAVADILDYDLPKVDLVLCLSVAMHLFRTGGATKGWEVLRRISRSAKRMFFDCVWGGYAPHLPFTEQTVVRDILEHTEFSKAKLLGRSLHENRPFYLFERADAA